MEQMSPTQYAVMMGVSIELDPSFDVVIGGLLGPGCSFHMHRDHQNL